MIPITIFVKRKWFTDKSTVGELTFDGIKLFTLEDTFRKDGFKIAGKTAIPFGTYEVIVNFSDRFQRPMPLLLNVPGFNGVRIHSGNTSADTLGCLLLGFQYDEKIPDFIGESRRAFSQFFPLLEDNLHKGKVYIEIS